MKRLAMLGLVGLFSSCGSLVGNQTPAGLVTGQVVVDGLSELPRGAVLTISLDDVTLADAPSVTLASQGFSKATFPLKYALQADASQINPVGRYTVSAEIRLNEDLLYRTDFNNSVLTQGGPHQMDVVLKKVIILVPTPQP